MTRAELTSQFIMTGLPDQEGGNMLLSNKVAIVTGSARGIGKGIATEFVKEGCSVVIADVIEETGRNTARELSENGKSTVVYMKCDVSNSRQVQEMVGRTIKELGKVDILVNNAGVGPAPKPITEVSEEEWDRTLAVNLKGVFLCCKAVAPFMMEKRYGKIINISSSSTIRPMGAPIYPYSASKAGVSTHTLDLAVALAPYNICVNAILPGIIRTEMMNNLPPSGVSQEEFFTQEAKLIPMLRMGTPEDIGKTALFLASDNSAYITGAAIVVGGGVPFKYK
jgi:3-oxoacyl-[acyl-carrier protein] reductase